MNAAVAEVVGRATAGYREALSHVEGTRAHVNVGTPAAAELNMLTVRLGAQRERLAALAAKAQLPPPWLDGVAPAAFTTLEQMLGNAKDALARADDALATVQRQVSPPLLPSASPTVRAALVFGAWSIVAWMFQCGLLVATSGTNVGAAVLSLCGMPIIAFAGSLVTLQLAGQPQAGARITYRVRVGAAICFLGMPLAWILLLIGLATLRG